jgi:hypothetical protein
MRALNLCVLVLILMRTCHGMQVLIMGASGGCGRHLLTDLTATDNVSVLALVRSEASLPELSEKARKRVKAVVIGGVETLSEADLLEHARGCDAIFSCLGHHEPGAKGVTWKGVYGPKNQRQICTDFSQKVCSVVRKLKPAKPIKYIVISSPFATGWAQGLPSEPKRSFLERQVLWLLEKLVPPHRDNVSNWQFLQTQMLDGESVNPYLEVCLVRPDNMVDMRVGAKNEDSEHALDESVAAHAVPKVGEYTIHENLQFGLFNGGVTSRENVGRFMADLVRDAALWERFGKNKLPMVLDAFQPARVSTSLQHQST